jgi:hypothetical protein
MNLTSSQKVDCIFFFFKIKMIKNKVGLFIPDLQRTKVLCPVNEPTPRIRSVALLDETYSITLLTTLDPWATEPIGLDIREGSNSAEDFLDGVRFFVEAGYLSEGDLLIFDNASIHIAVDIQQELLGNLFVRWSSSSAPSCLLT